jgi:tubulin-specific chaperone C
VNLSDLQAQMGRLAETSVIGGERIDAIDHLVAGIARLGSEVTDASAYLPAYDQRTYGEVMIFFQPMLCRANHSS